MIRSICLLTALLSNCLFAQQYMTEDVVTGLTQPVCFVFLPNNNILVTQKAGLANIYSTNNTLVSNFWNFTDSVSSFGERGLLGVVLDPNFQVNRYVYFYYISVQNKYRIVRLKENNNVGTDPYYVMNDSVANGSYHFAGNMRFGRDGKLYVSIGDNGLNGNGQLLTNFKGKILRMNTNGSAPSDNPFYDDGNPLTGNDDRIWAYGLRNSFDFCFSPVNDSLYATENTVGNPDEVNFIRKGKNYGWPVCEGYCFPYNPMYKNPITVLPGSDFGNYAPTGILVYTGSQMPELVNKLLVIGMGGQNYRGLVKCNLGNAPFFDTVTTKSILLDITGTTLMQGSDGYIYICRLSQGAIVRLKYDLTGINNNNAPVGFALTQNYPNPFNPATNIKFEIPKTGFVSLKIFDMIGNEISSLVSESKPPGSYDVSWDASNFPSGVYFYELRAGEFTERKKMVLVK